MRFYEYVSLIFYGVFAALAWVRRPAERRTAVSVIAGIGAALIFLAARTPFRDFLPVLLLPLAYWQTGQFRRPLNHYLQGKLLSFDRKYLRTTDVLVLWPLELAYLFCYPLIPLSILYLYASGLSHFAEQFWNDVLPPTYLCFATFPFVQTLPPRVVDGNRIKLQAGTRRVNEFVLHHLGIRGNTFPSSHIAVSMAIALAVLRYNPAAGALFFVAAMAIGISAVLGRYHYALDVILGAGLSLAWFCFSALPGFPR